MARDYLPRLIKHLEVLEELSQVLACQIEWQDLESMGITMLIFQWVNT